MRRILPFLLPGVLLMLVSCARDKAVEVGYLLPSDSAAVPFDVAAFFNGYERAALTVSTLDHPPDTPVLWVDGRDSLVYDALTRDRDRLHAVLSDAAESGSSILLTGYAALLPHELGWESVEPSIRRQPVANNWFFARKRGLQSLLGHPVFANGLYGGAFIWDPGDSTVAPVVGYFEDAWPELGRVVAVQKRYVHVDSDTKLLVEHDLPGGGKALSLGGWLDLGLDNLLRYRAERFLENSLSWLSGDSLGVDPSYWAKADSTIREMPRELSDEIRLAQLPDPSTVQFAPLEPSPLEIDIREPGKDWFSLGGRRTLVMGAEQGGISEAWAFPNRLLTNLRTVLQVPGRDPVDLSQRACDSLRVRPEAIRRVWRLETGVLTEWVVPALDKPGLLLRYEWQGERVPGAPNGVVHQPKVTVEFETDLRWMWPYDSDDLGTLRYRAFDANPALHVTNERGQFHLVAGADRMPQDFGERARDHRVVGPFEAIPPALDKVEGRGVNRQRVLVSLGRMLESPARATFAIAGSNVSLQEAYDTCTGLISDPTGVYNTAARHYTTLLDSMVRFETPDTEFNRLWDWTLVGIDRFMIDTPGLGEALVAGFGTREQGWGGGHDNSGRPGYAWYFGRDAVWSAFAIDDYGDFASVRRQLEFLRDFQDINGKIFHELTASGVVHYDAADSTPLYILLAAHYLRASGDLEFIRELYPSLLRAVDFLYSTDANGDGLIDNVNVGHGWVEGGSLWGSQTSIYLAGLWARTLREMHDIALELGEEGRARAFEADAEDVASMLETDFWLDDAGLYAFGKNADGSFNAEPTVLPATVAWFNPLDPGRMAPMLDEYASNAFTTDWGVRILSTRSPNFNPRAYHGGSVWPLFTGWASLAEYKYGRSASGFDHILNNLRIKYHWSEGYVEEVMHGDEYRPYGVCPHQCWSETNIAQPAIAGMLGWQPNAIQHSARLAPQFPAHWDQATVRNLRVGDTKLQLVFQRRRIQDPDREITPWVSQYYFSRTDGGPINLEFAPGLPPGSRIEQIRINGETVNTEVYRSGDRLDPPLRFELVDTAVVEFMLHGGLEMLPVMPSPKPGETSKGLRVIRQWSGGGSWHAIVEGPSGGNGTFRIRDFRDQAEFIVRGGAPLAARMPSDDMRFVRVDFPTSEASYVQQELVVDTPR